MPAPTIPIICSENAPLINSPISLSDSSSLYVNSNLNQDKLCHSPCPLLPKIILLNACSIKKLNSTNQKGCSLLAHDLASLNIDVALITETHLRTSIPDSYITIPGYQVFRRDRLVCNCRRSECSRPHKGGGVLIYCRSSLNSEYFDSADSCESLWIRISLPNDDANPLFINVTYCTIHQTRLAPL